MRSVASSDTLTVQDLAPVLADPASRLVLVRRLVREGLLVCRPRPPRGLRPAGGRDGPRRSAAPTRAKRPTSRSSAPRPPSRTGSSWSIRARGVSGRSTARVSRTAWARTLIRRERELRIRVLLIRRHGRAAARRVRVLRDPHRPRPAVDGTGGPGRRARRGDARPRRARQRPLRRADAGRYRPVRGLHARPARPVLRGAWTSARVGALQAYPDQTWESTHIGGDRFAGNMIAFPHGFYLGRVEPASGVAIAAGIPRRPDRPGAPPRPLLSSHRRAGGEHLLREAHDLTGVDDVAVDDVARTDADTVATFRTPLGRYRIAVRRTLGPLEQLTCHRDATERPPRFELLEDVAIAP